MATYVIGDVQGCYRELQTLLQELGFNRARDQLWFAGDLVNRGPDSLSVLRFVRELGSSSLTVLGNHDLHLLACAAGTRKPHRLDTLNQVLHAPDREVLLDWLRQQPLMHVDDSGNALVHAGLPPQWSVQAALGFAREVETVLRSNERDSYFAHMYGNEPDKWLEELSGFDRLRFITNCLTRMRYCSRKGKLDLKAKGAPGTENEKLLPWYAVPDRQSTSHRILFGHWATLHLGAANTEGCNVVGLDTGCVWGGRLTAIRLDDNRMFSVPSQTRAAGSD
ncbi:MAG: symmetrical bis(5'-nucleosyl)-tetraphosphatase [Gammaproteobacteria bacterium]